MSQLTPEQSKINIDIAKKLDIGVGEVEKVLELYFKGVATKIKEDRPCEIIIPFLGRLYPKKSKLEIFNDKTDEVNNTGG